MDVVEGPTAAPQVVEPLRIAVIAPPWIPVPPTSYGGTEAVLDVLCRGLTAAGHDVLLVASGDSTCPVERVWCHAEALGTEFAATTSELMHVACGYDAARRWGADIVHDHTLSGPSFGTLDGTVPVVTTNHGPFDGDLALTYRRLSRQVPVIAISHAHAGAAPGCAATVIHHGVDVASYGPVGAGTGPALFLGRMCPDKGVHVAIDVARRAGVPLTIAAKMREPAERRYYEQEVEPRLGGDVVYVGEVDRRTQVELLRQARCLLNPIQWDEPFGMVVIEALASGAPVVATPRGSMPELIEHGVTGFLHGSVDGLAAGVRAAADLDRAACRAVAEQSFSMEAVAARHVAFYCSVLARSRHAAARS